MMTYSNPNADGHLALPSDGQVRVAEPSMLGVGRALRCAYAQPGKLSDLRLFESLIAGLKGK